MKIDQQVKLWKWLASILPLTALAVILLVYFLGTDTYLKLAMITSVAGFMLASFISTKNQLHSHPRAGQ